MGIPEHKKCVALSKNMRRTHQTGNWRNVRHIRRKKGEIKHKIRIRQMLKVEFEMEKSRIRKRYSMGYINFMKIIRGKYYRKWRKYDD